MRNLLLCLSFQDFIIDSDSSVLLGLLLCMPIWGRSVSLLSKEYMFC